MSTFKWIQTIAMSRWEDPAEQPVRFKRPTEKEFEAYYRNPKRRKGQAGSGVFSLFRIFAELDFKSDSDLLLRHTSLGGAAYLRREGLFYALPGEADNVQLVLSAEEYSTLLNLIVSSMVRKPARPGPFQGSALLKFTGIGHDDSPLEEEVSVRVSGLPSLGSWSVCFRFIRVVEKLPPLQDIYVLDYFRNEILQRLVVQTKGLLLISGPTGHGKTTAAYSILRELHSQELNFGHAGMRHVLTIEGPIECRMDNATQIEVNYREDFSFAHAFHEALRHGPEVFFIGEIRSAEAARAAVDAALSGHLTVATIHGGSAFDAIARMIGFGISSRELSAALAGVINQRLVEQLCRNPACSSPVDLNDRVQSQQVDWARTSSRQDDGGGNLRNPVRGSVCGYCQGKGFDNRLVLAGITPNTAELREWLREGASDQKPGSLENAPLSFATYAARLAMKGLVSLDAAYTYSELNRDE